MSNEIYIAKQETLLETKTKVEAVQNTLVETETKIEAVQNTLSQTNTKVHAVQNTLATVGKTNDSGGTPTTGTVAAKENAILTEVNKIGNTTDTGATTVFGKLNAGVLKSIQRGIAKTPLTTDKVITINLSAVNLEKSIVILDNQIVGFGIKGSSASTYPLYGAYIVSFTSAALSVAGNYADYNNIYGSVSWQVIEFR